MSKRGRPKQEKELVTLDFTTFLEDITLFKNGLIDSLADEENENMKQKQLIAKFLEMDLPHLNLFIIYLLNKSSRFTFKQLADLLHIDKCELMRTVKQIKIELEKL